MWQLWLRFANPIPIPLKFEDHYNIEVDNYFEKGLKDYYCHPTNFPKVI
jgi:hypothetical protein